MSKRFGRNQKRRLQQERDAALDAVAMLTVRNIEKGMEITRLRLRLQDAIEVEVTNRHDPELRAIRTRVQARHGYETLRFETATADKKLAMMLGGPGVEERLAEIVSRHVAEAFCNHHRKG